MIAGHINFSNSCSFMNSRFRGRTYTTSLNLIKYFYEKKKTRKYSLFLLRCFRDRYSYSRKN